MLRTMPTPLIPANRAGELLDELLFDRVIEHIDVAGLQRLEAELWTTLIDLDVDLGGQSPMAQARALITRALQRFIDDPVRAARVAEDAASCAPCVDVERSSAG